MEKKVTLYVIYFLIPVLLAIDLPEILYIWGSLLHTPQIPTTESKRETKIC